MPSVPSVKFLIIEIIIIKIAKNLVSYVGSEAPMVFKKLPFKNQIII